VACLEPRLCMGLSVCVRVRTCVCTCVRPHGCEGARVVCGSDVVAQWHCVPLCRWSRLVSARCPLSTDCCRLHSLGVGANVAPGVSFVVSYVCVRVCVCVQPSGVLPTSMPSCKRGCN
jgi:hypothetical protein